MSGNGQSPHQGYYDGTKASSPQRINAAALGGTSLPRGSEASDLARADLHRNLESDFGKKRDLYEALGYPQTSEISYPGLFGKYLRDPIARTIVDKPAEDTWQEPPEISDAGDPEGDREETRFEEGVRKLLNGDTLRKALSYRWFVADILNRLGRYSAIYFSFADGSTSLEESVLETDDEGTPTTRETFEEDTVNDRLNNLWHVQVYSEDRADVDELDDDFRSPRYGLPETYRLEPEESREEDAHWSRIIHVAESTRTNDLYGESVLLPVFNRLEDLERLLGGSSEMFWQGAFPGMVVSPPVLSDRDGSESFADFAEDEGENTKDQIRQMRNTLERAMFTQADVQTLTPNISSPSDHVEVQLDAISAGTSPTIPQNMLIGNELGERATSEDRKSYHEAIQSRRKNFAEPTIVRPTIDRLIDVGILPEPAGGEYDVEWVPIVEKSEQEKADIDQTTAQAAKNAADAAAAAPEIREELFGRLGYDVGEDAEQEASDPADQILEDRTNAHRRSRRDRRQNATRYDAGDVVATPNGRGVVVSTRSSTFDFPTGEDSSTEVSVSSNQPAYIVALGGRSAVYPASALASTTFSEDAQTETDGERLTPYASDADVSTSDLPSGWTAESALSALASANGSVDDLADSLEEGSGTDDAVALAATIVDYAAGTTLWRGGF